MRRVDPLYLASAAFAIVAIAVLVATAAAPSASASRSGSVYDDGPGGAGALRRYLTAMGASTTTIEGTAFEASGPSVVMLLGATESVSEADAARVHDFVVSGGTVVLATDLGFAERPLLDAFGMRVTGVAAPGEHELRSAAFADPPARTLSIDRGAALGVGPNADILATDGRAPIVASVKEGSGLFIVVASLWPFTGAGLAEADNARVVLALVKPALGRGTLAFDEYHHGVHPTSDITVLVQETWPGRALVFAAAVAFLYLLLSGRRLGPPVPLEARPARSSLEYIRGFAGLVRRSGRGEIARMRLRADLRAGLARRLGLDPATPFERVVSALAVHDRERAAQARALDEALARPLREDRLLRTVAQIDRLLAEP
ncbi:MAG TPA: DUF4350 domain-containing protein [Candidatus Limnocylindria bacterium]|nr:DUF4350 domain-containing protein [Candidatus Limnocylindria bacterium]